MVPAFVIVFIRPMSVNVDKNAAIGFLFYKEEPINWLKIT
jgi:xanthine/uracil/vitamin C permease (AzgA family)